MVGAVHATTRVEQPSISLGEGEAGPKSVTLTVTNDSDVEKICDGGFHLDVEFAPTRLRELATQANTTASGKYQVLLAELRRIGISRSSPERVVVFAERIATLTWLAEHLRAVGGRHVSRGPARGRCRRPARSPARSR